MIAHVNYTTTEDIPEGEQVLVGTFSLNRYPIVILFDSGASHHFISKACTQKHQLAIEDMHTPCTISTPGGKIFTRQVVVNPSLNLGGRVYKTCLIVLEEQWIDVMLGMK
jgi:predicted aspartyl protease